MKIIVKGSASSGWYAPPKGTHTGEKHRTVGSGKSAVGGRVSVEWERTFFGNFSAKLGNKNALIRLPNPKQFRDEYELTMKKEGNMWVEETHIASQYSTLKSAQQAAAKFFQSDEGFIHYQTALNMMRAGTLPEQKRK